MILPMLAAPLAAALVAWLFRRLRALAALVSALGVLAVAFLALYGMDAPPLIVLGRSLALASAARLHLAIALGLLAVCLVAMARLPERDIAWILALAGTSLLVGFLAIQTLTLATLTLQAGLAVLVMLIPLQKGDPAPIHMRALVVLVLAGALALAAAWLLEYPDAGATGAPSHVGPIALTAAYGAMLGAFPFFVWLLPIYRSDSGITRVMFGVVLPHILLARLLAMQGGVLALSAELLPMLLLNVGIATFVVGCLGALAQRTVGGLMGYMAMSELGVALMALGSGMPKTDALAVAHLLARGMAIVAMSVGVSILRQSFGSDRLDDLRGAIRRAPVTSVAVLLAGFSLAGLPPLTGFVTRFALYRVIAIEGLGWATALVVFGLAPALAIARLAMGIFQVAPTPGSRREPLWPASLALLLGLLLLAWGLLPQAPGYLPPAWADLLFGLAG